MSTMPIAVEKIIPLEVGTAIENSGLKSAFADGREELALAKLFLRNAA